MQQSDSLIHTLLGMLSKRDLITEQTAKYLIQYFQFFVFYSSLGLPQCLHLIRCEVPLTLMQFALDDLPTTLSNISLGSMLASSSSVSSSFALNYSKMSSSQLQSQNNNANNSGAGCSSQYADLNKLYCVVSTLLRCYDVTPYCATYQQHANEQARLG